MFLVGLNKNSIQPCMQSGKGRQTEKQAFFCICICICICIQSGGGRRTDEPALSLHQ